VSSSRTPANWVTSGRFPGVGVAGDRDRAVAGDDQPEPDQPQVIAFLFGVAALGDRGAVIRAVDRRILLRVSVRRRRAAVLPDWTRTRAPHGVAAGGDSGTLACWVTRADPAADVDGGLLRWVRAERNSQGRRRCAGGWCRPRSATARGPGPTSEELSEIKRLRAQVRDLKEANEILKVLIAAASFVVVPGSTSSWRSSGCSRWPASGCWRDLSRRAPAAGTADRSTAHEKHRTTQPSAGWCGASHAPRRAAGVVRQDSERVRPSRRPARRPWRERR
jgi:transposase-like protein